MQVTHNCFVLDPCSILALVIRYSYLGQNFCYHSALENAARISYKRYLLNLLYWTAIVATAIQLRFFSNLRSNRSKPFSLAIDFGSETTNSRFYILNNWFDRLTRGLILLVTDNHMDNNINEFFVYVYNHTINPKSLCLTLLMFCSVYRGTASVFFFFFFVYSGCWIVVESSSLFHLIVKTLIYHYFICLLCFNPLFRRGFVCGIT